MGAVPTWRLLLAFLDQETGDCVTAIGLWSSEEDNGRVLRHLGDTWFGAWTRASVRILHCYAFRFNGIAKTKPVLGANTEDVLIALDQMIAFDVVRCKSEAACDHVTREVSRFSIK